MLNIFRRKGRQEFPYKTSWPPIPIVGDAGIGTKVVGDGRIIPLVILDTAQRADVSEMILMQNDAPPGDAESAWTTIRNGPADHLALLIQFQRPAELGLTLYFDLSRQGSIVELALQSHAIYIRSGKPGDRYITNPDAPTMLIELGASLPSRLWNELWFKAIVHRLRKEGVVKWKARKAATEHINLMRETTSNPFKYGSGLYVGLQSGSTDDTAQAKLGVD